jgi:hypothetical protein
VAQRAADAYIDVGRSRGDLAPLIGFQRAPAEPSPSPKYSL